MCFCFCSMPAVTITVQEGTRVLVWVRLSEDATLKNVLKHLVGADAVAWHRRVQTACQKQLCNRMTPWKMRSICMLNLEGGLCRSSFVLALDYARHQHLLFTALCH